jgi:hypothetical protein
MDGRKIIKTDRYTKVAGQGTARESRASRKAATLNLLLQEKIKRRNKND